MPRLLPHCPLSPTLAPLLRCVSGAGPGAASMAAVPPPLAAPRSPDSSAWPTIARPAPAGPGDAAAPHGSASIASRPRRRCRSSLSFASSASRPWRRCRSSPSFASSAGRPGDAAAPQGSASSAGRPGDAAAPHSLASSALSTRPAPAGPRDAATPLSLASAGRPRRRCCSSQLCQQRLADRLVEGHLGGAAHVLHVPGGGTADTSASHVTEPPHLK